MDGQTLEIIQQLIEWHNSKVESLRLVEQHKDADIKLGDTEIKAGSEMHVGVRIGISVALESLGKLPISLESNK